MEKDGQSLAKQQKRWIVAGRAFKMMDNRWQDI